ncbi:MAG: GIY-YIG nuclease family protein [Candidatus Marinimicrobia bacterium]|nr:GIY-YIG nuclease family protein [Candidatus Neomarinimicrobiota bacterium]
MKNAYTYILSNKNRTTLYVGVTNDLERRMFEHKAHRGSKFCKKYNLDELMYYEHYNFMMDAIDREKQLKRWHSKWKWDLIKELNPKLLDLSKPWFDKDDLEDIKAYRNNQDISFHYASSSEKWDPESSLKQVQPDVVQDDMCPYIMKTHVLFWRTKEKGRS